MVEYGNVDHLRSRLIDETENSDIQQGYFNPHDDANIKVMRSLIRNKHRHGLPL